MGFWDGFKPGAVAAPSTPKAAPGATSTGSGGFWGGYSAQVAPTPAPPSPIETKVINSFMSLPQTERNLTYKQLQVKANAGDAGASRKLALLGPKLNQNAPTNPTYKLNSWDSFWNSAAPAVNNLVGGAVDLATGSVGQTAGETVTRPTPTAKPTKIVAGHTNDAVEAAAPVLAKYAAAFSPTMGANSEDSRVPNAKSLPNMSPKAANAADNLNTALAAGTPGALHLGGKAVGSVVGAAAKSAARYIANPIEDVAMKRVASMHPELNTGTKADKPAFFQAVDAEVNKIKSDPVQKQAIAEAYHQGGTKGLDVTTGLSDKGTPEHYHAAGALAAQAKAGNEDFQAKVAQVGHELGGQTVKAGPPKTANRIYQKAANDYHGDVTQVRDASRATIHLHDPAQLQSYLDTIGKHFEITRVKNGLDNEGYQDVKVNVKTPEGHQAELLLATPEMLRAKDELGGHALYEQHRVMPDGPEAKAIEAKMNQLYTDATQAAKSRLTSSADSSLPSNKALYGAKGAPVESTTPKTSPDLESRSNLTTVSSTSKNLGNGRPVSDSGITPPSEKTVPQEGENVNKSVQSGVGSPKSIGEFASDPKVQAEATRAAGRRLLAVAKEQGAGPEDPATLSAQYMIETGQSPHTPTGPEVSFQAWKNDRLDQMAGAKQAVDQLAREHADMVKHTSGVEEAQRLLKDVKAQGGIKTDAGIKAEQNTLATRIRNNSGLTPDDMAQQLREQGYQFEDGEQLRDALHRAQEKITNAPSDADLLAKAHDHLAKTDVAYQSAKAYADGKPILQDVNETLSTPDATTRVKQYEESLKATIAGIEKSPGYQAELSAKGGGEVISNKETYAKALKAGPLDNETIKNWQAGEPVDSVTLVRAKATLNTEAKAFTDKWQNGGLGPQELDAAAKELAQLEAGYHVMSAEPGRATQIQASFVDKQYEAAQNLKKLLTETKGPNKDEIIKKGVDEFAKQSEKTEKSGVFSAETAKRLTDMLAEYATAAKLTSPLTHLVNIASNLLTLPQRGAENLVTAGWGALKGHTSLEQAKYIFGTTQGLRTATAQFGRDLAQAVNPKAKDINFEGGKTETTKPAIPGVAGKVIRTPFNMLSAADNFFKSMLRDSELHQRAFQQGYTEGFRGKELANRVTELVNSPTPELQARVDKVAKEFTFQADPGPLSKGLTQTLGKVPLMRLLIPFVTTPVNLAKFQIQRTPLGVFAPRNIKAVMAGGLERQEAVARIGVGTGLSIAGVMAVMNAGDNIVGAAPTNPGDKDNFYHSGKKPYSIKIGNTWVQYNRFQPIGMYLTQAVNLRDALQSGNKVTAGNIFTSLAVGTAKGIADLPFVSGVNNVITALNDPTNQANANKAIGGLVTGLIPNISRDIASYGDSTQRSAKTITDQVKLMIPGFVPGFNRNQVTPRTATFGGTQPNAGTPLQRGFIKIVSPDQSSKLTKTIDDIGQNTGYYPQAPSAKTKVRGKVLSPSDFAKYQDLSGRKLGSELQKALGDAAFTGAGPDDQAKQLQAMVADSRKGAAQDMFGKAPKTTPTKIKHYNK